MIVHKDATLNDLTGVNQDVYECEVCNKRSIFSERIIDCERKHSKEYHEEEHLAGVL